MLAYQQWRQRYRQGQLNEVQRRFFEPKPVEMLFDVEADPHEVKNLAGDPACAEVLRDLRSRLQAKVKGLPDLSFYPESHLVQHAMDDPVAFGRQHAREIAELADTADLALLPFDEAAPRLTAALQSDNPWQRYWALIACSCFGDRAKTLVPAVRALVDDPELLVRVRAAECLGILGAADPRPALYAALAATESPVEALLTLNTVVFFHDRGANGYRFDVDRIKLKVQSGETDRRLQYLATTAAGD
jgi:HEAT repeat protein